MIYITVLKGKRIFYVEDNPGNASVAQVILEQAGAKVMIERYGRDEVLPKLKAFMPIDIILLDLMFPMNVTGYDIFDLIRTDPTFNAIPILAVSASDPEIEVPKLRKRGFVGLVSKPLDLRRFPQQVSSAMQGQTVWPI